MEHGVLSRHSSSSMTIWSTSLPQTACVRRATAFPPLGPKYAPRTVCVRVSPWVFVCARWCWGGPMAAQTLGTGVSRSRRRGASAAVTLLLLPALLTCRVRCAEPSTKPNIVLIVTDDQDVVLGGLVSGQKKRRKVSTALNWSDFTYFCTKI